MITPPPDFSYSGRTAATLGGDVPLDVVGESYRQDALWRLVGGRRPEPVRQEIVAVLVPEAGNDHDANAVMVLIDDQLVGYLSRLDAARYRPGLEALIERIGLVALSGAILGSGQHPDGLGRLGVVLRHEPSDFIY